MPLPAEIATILPEATANTGLFLPVNILSMQCYNYNCKN